jgi:SEC-C motif-containing protein
MTPLCPCGSSLLYSQCCGLYIEENVLPPTPEALMRSRYSAHVVGNVDYIANTMRSPALDNFSINDTRTWLEQVKWDGLTVIQAKLKTPQLGFVSFEAQYTHGGKKHIMKEKSEFHLIDDQWFYVTGKALNPHSRK